MGQMRNPWLDIPLADYEEHMSLPAIAQSRMIADQLETLLDGHRPRSVAIVGCAGGNGFDRIPRAGVRRLVGVDINPRYVERAAHRYSASVPGLELHVGDIQSSGQLFEPVDFIYAALLFEYVALQPTMSALSRHCRPGGVLAALTQLPHESIATISPSPHVSLRLLEPAMHLVSPEDLQVHAASAGFAHEDTTVITSAGGKRFAVQVFRR